MIPFKSPLQLTVPPTLEKRLDALAALRTLQAQDDQSLTDPNGDASPWDPFTLAPTFPVDPLPVPEMPVFPRIFVPAW